MSKYKSKIIIAVAVLLVALGIGLALSQTGKDKPKQAAPAPNAQVQQAPQVQEVKYDGVEGKNALELLKQSHKVDTKTYEGLGELVTGIDGVSADSKHFWALYVNDQQSQVGASAYATKANDKITWKLEEIK